GWAAEEPTPAQYVCCANVHMTMETYDSPEFRDVVNGASLVTSDGMPLVWMLHRLGISEARPVNGPTMILEVCRAAAELGLRVGFYGASQQTLDVLTDKLLERFPLLEIGYAFSPPYRSLSAYEDEKIVDDILAANLRILFVGLGCPRQELWMAE